MSKPWSQVTTLSAVGATPKVELLGPFNFTLIGTFVGTVQLQRSFDAGTTWVNVTDSTGAAVSFTGQCSMMAYEPEQNVVYRANVTALSSGSITVRLSQ